MGAPRTSRLTHCLTVSVHSWKVNPDIEAFAGRAAAADHDPFNMSGGRAARCGAARCGRPRSDRATPRRRSADGFRSRTRSASARELSDRRVNDVGEIKFPHHGSDRARTWLVDPFSSGISFPGWKELAGHDVMWKAP